MDKISRQGSSRTVILEDVTSAITTDSDELITGTELPVTTQLRQDYGACEPSSSGQADEQPGLIKKTRCGCACSSANCLGSVLLLVALVTTAIFTIPLLVHFLYHGHLEKGPSHSQNFSCDTMENCSMYDQQANHGAFNYSCIAVHYTSDTLPICKKVLTKWQCCQDHDKYGLLVNATTASRESIVHLISILQSAKHNVISKECQEPAVQFLCQYAFPLCDNQTSTLLLPSKRQCTDLRDKFCVLQWKFIQQSYPADIPNCDLLPGSKTVPPDQSGNITCSNMFVKRNGFCSPDCTKLSTMGYRLSIFWNIIFPILVGLGLTAAVGIIAAFLIEYKKMCSYPLLYVLYMTVSWMLPAILILIGKFDRSLFCNGQDDNILHFNSTIFCLISGITLHWFLSSTSFMWLFLVLSILYKAGRHNPTQLELKMSKYVHIMLTVIGLCAPLPAVVTNIVEEGKDQSYVIPFFPPLFCMEKNLKITYYSIILEVNIFIGIGINLYLLIFWLMFKYRSILKARGKTALGRLSAAEMKLLFLYLYYIIFATIIILYYVIATKDNVMKDLQNYFLCENNINKQETGCTKQLSTLQGSYYNRLLIPLLVALACFPFCNLVFILGWKRVWNITASCCRILKNSLPQPRSTVYSTLTGNQD